MSIINFADIVEGNGKTVRENNFSKGHNIPVHSIIEVNCKGSNLHRLRLYVTAHGQDCDGSPLYYLSHDPHAFEKYNQCRQDVDNKVWEETPDDIYARGIALWKLHNAQGALINGWSEDGLILIHEASKLPESE